MSPNSEGREQRDFRLIVSDTKHTLTFHHIKLSPKRSKRLLCFFSLCCERPPDSHLLQMLDACGHGKTGIMACLVFITHCSLSALIAGLLCAFCTKTNYLFSKLSTFVSPTLFFHFAPLKSVPSTGLACPPGLPAWLWQGGRQVFYLPLSRALGSNAAGLGGQSTAKWLLLTSSLISLLSALTAHRPFKGFHPFVQSNLATQPPHPAVVSDNTPPLNCSLLAFFCFLFFFKIDAWEFSLNGLSIPCLTFPESTYSPYRRHYL